MVITFWLSWFYIGTPVGTPFGPGVVCRVASPIGSARTIVVVRMYDGVELGMNPVELTAP